MTPAPRCPVCDRPMPAEGSPAAPFCSPRCRQIDLARWLGEQYAVPHVGRLDDEEGELPEEPE